MIFQSSLLGIVVLVTAAAAVTDARSGRIPNSLTLPFVALTPLVHFVHGGPGGLFFSLIGAALSIAAPLVLFLKRAMGGGDVKLFCGIGGMLGPSLGLEVQLVAYAIAGAYAVVHLVRRGQLRQTLSGVLGLRAQCAQGLDSDCAKGLRLGVPIFLAALLCAGARFTGV